MRTALTFLLVAALAAPAYAAPTVSTSTPAPAPVPGSPFSQPVQDLVGQDTTETTVANTSRSKGEDNGRSTLLFLSLAALVMIAGVGGFIWYEGRQMGGVQKRRRQRMRSGRTPQPAAAGSGARRGPPPPPRKRRSQAAKRKKR